MILKKFRGFFIILLLSLPILASFTTGSTVGAYSSFLSPEGIHFVSYSREWDEHKLVELYEELKQNKYGEEINRLQEIRVEAGRHSSGDTKGSYHAILKTIILYQGDKYLEPADYRETLSHEYGHHFAYYYFPSHHLPFSRWQKLRGINVGQLQWDAFWNYEEKNHSFYPQEIIADDYVLLYGATNHVSPNDVYSNEAFYLRTQHENQQLPNVLENKELLAYLEEESGVAIDKNRLIQTPSFTIIEDDKISFSVTEKSNIAYRLNIELFSPSNEQQTLELYTITDDEDNEINFSLNDVGYGHFSDYESAIISIDVVDLTTSIGFETKETTLNF
ncbi:hypothetical protein COD11_10045 [Bacillus sp. AFS040349]|nr:hypothetical protein COD11_10045 [Bacillus sp. AFS040349]